MGAAAMQMEEESHLRYFRNSLSHGECWLRQRNVSSDFQDVDSGGSGGRGPPGKLKGLGRIWTGQRQTEGLLGSWGLEAPGPGLTHGVVQKAARGPVSSNRNLYLRLLVGQ